MSSTHCALTPGNFLAACSQIHLAPSAMTLSFASGLTPTWRNIRFQLLPTASLSAIALHARRAVESGSTRSFHDSGAVAAADSRLLSTLSLISRHPSVVLTQVPSE